MDLQRVVKSESADSQKVEIAKRHYHTISFQVTIACDSDS